MGWLSQVLPVQPWVAPQQPSGLSLLQLHATPGSLLRSWTRYSTRCSDIHCSYSIGFMRLGSCKKPILEVKRTARLDVSAAIREIKGSVINTEGLRFAVVVGRFNEFVTRPLVAGALETFKAHAVKEENIEVVWVPGAFEIPVVAQALAGTGDYHAVLCIGTVIRGETTHYDAVANSAASGILSAGLKSGVPCIFGVLTCETLEQALHRAGGKAGNKGAEAAVTAIEMASLFQHHLRK